MRVLLTILVLCLCASCAKRVPLPETEIDFVSVAKPGDSALLDIRFSSMTDLLRFFEINAGQHQVGNALICSLDESGFFETKQDLTRYLEGEVVAVLNESAVGPYVYSAEVSAVHTPDGGTLSTYFNKKQLLMVLSARQVVACKFRTAAYAYGPYYSKSMNIPASVFVQAIERQ